MAFKISSACFAGSGTQEVEGSLPLGGCGTGPEGPGCWGLTFSDRALGLRFSVFRLTNTGVSYLSRESAGGIIVAAGLATL